MSVLKQGIVQVITGDGKIKTTAALGLSWRMLGAGGKVYVCQFFKPEKLESSEMELVRRFENRLAWHRIDYDWNTGYSWDDPEHIEAMRELIGKNLEHIGELAAEGAFDLMILEEILFCLNKDFVKLHQIIDLISSRAAHVELVLTGKGAHRSILDLADMVTEVIEIKHPWHKLNTARKGIEY